jgi:hypothetical protein
MYLLDKGFAWTGLWMMVVSPFAGNLLALGSIYEKWSNIDTFQKIVRSLKIDFCLSLNASYKKLVHYHLTPSVVLAFYNKGCRLLLPAYDFSNYSLLRLLAVLDCSQKRVFFHALANERNVS